MDLKLAEKLAKSYFAYHGLSKTWSFGFNRARVTFGRCNFGEKQIVLSKILTKLNSEGHVKNTILHEIAHALVGVEQGHNKVWRKKALTIGCDGQRCYDSSVILPPKKYTGHCPNGHTIYSNRHTKVSCGRCSKTWNPAYMISWD